MSEKIIPSQRQLEFMDWEFGVFFHFGIRSFFKGHKDWDNRPMPADQFNPHDQAGRRDLCHTDLQAPRRLRQLADQVLRLLGRPYPLAAWAGRRGARVCERLP